MENLAHSELTTATAATGGEWIAIEKLSEGAEHIGGMLVRSEQMRTIVKTLKRLGPHQQTVLIEGESGTGKELIAWALHSFGTAPDRPFVTFNCSNLVDTPGRGATVRPREGRLHRCARRRTRLFPLRQWRHAVSR